MEERSALTAGGGALLDAPAGVAAACWADGCGGGFGIGAGMAER